MRRHRWVPSKFALTNTSINGRNNSNNSLNRVFLGLFWEFQLSDEPHVQAKRQLFVNHSVKLWSDVSAQRRQHSVWPFNQSIRRSIRGSASSCQCVGRDPSAQIVHVAALQCVIVWLLVSWDGRCMCMHVIGVWMGEWWQETSDWLAEYSPCTNGTNSNASTFWHPKT